MEDAAAACAEVDRAPTTAAAETPEEGRQVAGDGGEAVGHGNCLIS